MEVKPLISGVTHYLFLFLIAISSLSCSSSRISIEVLKLPIVELSQPMESVVVLNRVDVQYANTKQYVNGKIISQYNGISHIMVNESVHQLVSDLTSNQFVNAVDTHLVYVPKNGKFTRGSFNGTLLSTKDASRVCTQLRVDGIITIDGYDAEIETESDVQYSTPVDRNYGTVQIPYFSGDQTVLMQMLFRTYTCKDFVGKIENETSLATQVAISTSGSSPYEVNSKLGDANNVMIQAARKLGTEYAEQIAPRWKTQSRSIYASGSDQLKQAYGYAKTGNWPLATDIWYLVATSNNEKVAKRASFNLILSSEIAGDLVLAEEWAQRCIDKYNMDEAEKYLALIKKRKKEIEQIEMLFPLMVF